ncbi:MAG: VPLPA-CTERM sorting domain-containing protein [Pseudomonadota bacterium]
MKKLLVLAGSALALSAPAGLAATFDEVIAFGDSLNDCCINPAAPFTNGEDSWLVEFTDLIGATYTDSTLYNYAIGGAQSGDSNAIAPGGVPAPDGLQSQIDRFETEAPAISADDLAIIWVGTNDIWPSSYAGDTLFGLEGLDILKPLGQDPGTGDLAAYIAGNIGTAVGDLRDAGFGSALILTPYDIGDSALIDTPGGPAQNTAYSEALVDALELLYTPGIDTFVLDVVEVIRDLQAGSPENGFTELGTAPSCTFGEFICEERSPEDQDSFIYYDFVHLTTATNSEIAAAAAALVSDGAPISPVPLPAGVWLMAVAMAGLGYARRRRTPS